MNPLVGAAFALLLASGPGAAELQGPAPVPGTPQGVAPLGRRAVVPDELTYHGSAGELEVETPLRPDAAIRVDGRVEEGEWEGAAHLKGFTQFRPNEGIPASQETRIRVLVTEDALYLAVEASDDAPSGIRATLAERDNVARADDYLRFTLDTFNDSRRAYVFIVNPLGVQQDGIWVEGGGERRGFGPPIDYNPDLIWESAGRIHDGGWSAEIRIPFKSLRFPEAPVQSWGFQALRNIERTGYESTWAPLSENLSNQLSQTGTLTDLRGLDPGLFLEVNPVLTGRRIGEVSGATDEFVTGDPEVDFGANVTYGLTSNLTLDATFNPDFSQVEADAGQISVNERFALFFDEKRPFFLEGTEIFSMPQRLVHTRTIVDPIAGAKLTGKVGGLQLGYLGAVDEIGGDQASGDAVVNLVRARKDLGRSSTLGLLYTDRTRAGDDFNRVGAADARLVFAQRYTLELLGAASVGEDALEGQARESGGLLFARLERSGRELSFNASLEDVSPDFRTRSGFIRRTGDVQVNGEVRYEFFGEPGALVESVEPSVEFRGFWEHDAFWAGRGLQEGQMEIQGGIDLRSNVSINTSYSRSVFDFTPQAYQGLSVVEADGGRTPFRPSQAPFQSLDGIRIFAFVNSWESVRARFRTEWRETPVFERSLGVPVVPADGFSADWSFNLKLARSLTAEVGIRHESLFASEGREKLSSATIPRIRAQYQFTRALFLRGILEVASQEREALVDPVTGRPLEVCRDGECEILGATESHDVHVEALLSYEPSPGTIMFLGYIRDMEDSSAFAFRDLEPRAEGIFAKVSYRHRF